MKHGVKVDRQHNTSSNNRQDKVEFYLLLGFFSSFFWDGWMTTRERKLKVMVVDSTTSRSTTWMIDILRRSPVGGPVPPASASRSLPRGERRAVW